MNLRPARETCEECHWPEKFYGAQLMQNPYFRYNEKNAPEQINPSRPRKDLRVTLSIPPMVNILL